jgi:SAM-dependent methyltransferase
MSTDQGTGANYPMGRSEDETQRLIRQADAIRESTRRFLDEAGLRPGMRVLDVGSGAGDVALLAAELVGPSGSVVGVDVNPTILETAAKRVAAAGLANVAFLPGDFRTVALDGPFDALIGRYVLMYLADPAGALRAGLRHVRCGGLVAFREYEFSLGPVAHPPSALLEQGRGWMLRALATAGVDTSMGFHLHRAFLDAGLPDPQTSGVLLSYHGPHAGGYEEFAGVLRSLLPRIVGGGIATADAVGIDTYADRLREEVVRQNSLVFRTPMIGTWARKS